MLCFNTCNTGSLHISSSSLEYVDILVSSTAGFESSLESGDIWLVLRLGRHIFLLISG